MKLETPLTIAPVPDSLSWTTIDSVQVPCFTRRERNYIPTRLVEERLLSQYPSNVDNITPLIGYHATETEAETLNNILAKANESNTTKYTTEDVLVSLEDFLSFYEELKRGFGSKKTVSGGWLQVNNIVAPYVFRSDAKLVPVEIVRYGAQLLTDMVCDEYQLDALTEEADYLNRSLESGGFSYSVQPSESKLIDLAIVWSLCKKKPHIRELPAEDPMSHASFDDTAIAEIHSSMPYTDAEVTTIRKGKGTPVLIELSDDDEDDVVPGAQVSNVQIDNNSECAAVKMDALPTLKAILYSQSLESTRSNSEVGNVQIENSAASLRRIAVQTPAATSSSESMESIRSNSEASFVADLSIEAALLCDAVSRDSAALLCDAVSRDSAAYACSPSTMAGNALRNSTSRAQGKSAKMANPANVGNESRRRHRTKTRMSTGNLKKKRRLAGNPDLSGTNNTSSPSLFTTANPPASNSHATQFSHDSNAVMNQFNLRPRQANQFIGSVTNPSDGSYFESASRRAQPYSSFRADDSMVHSQGSSSIYNPSNSRFRSTSLVPTLSNVHGPPPSYSAVQNQHNAMASVPPEEYASLDVNSTVPLHCNDAVSSQLNSTRDMGSSPSCGGTASYDFNGMPSRVIPSHGNGLFLPQSEDTFTANNNGTVASYHDDMVVSNRNSMTSGISNETVPSSRNAIVSMPSEQIMAPQSDCMFSAQNNELPSCFNGRSGTHNYPEYLTRQESYPSVNEVPPHYGHLYPGTMLNRSTYPNFNQSNGRLIQPESTVPALASGRLENLAKWVSNRIKGDDLNHPYIPPLCFPTENPLPRSLEPQSGDFPISNAQQRQNSQYQYQNKTNAMLAKHYTSLTPRTYPSTVDSTDHASVDNIRTSAQFSKPNDQKKLDYSKTKPWIVVRKLANSDCIIIATLHRRRVYCLLKNKTMYVLLQSLHKAFFRNCSLESWLHMFFVNCCPKTISLTTEEEIVFIECYKLSGERLHCNRVIALDEFCKYLPSFGIL